MIDDPKRPLHEPSPAEEELKTHERRIFWIALLLPPAVWFVNLSASYAFAVESCDSGELWPIWVTMGASLLVAGGAVLFAHHEWKRMGRPHRALDPRDAGVAEFLAAGGHLLTAYFFVVILAAILPPLIFGPCGIGGHG